MESGNNRPGRGQGRGDGRGGRSAGPPFQSPVQPRPSGQFQLSGAPHNQPVSQNPGRGGATAWPRPPQQQSIDVPSPDWPQRQASGVSSTEYPPLPQRQASSVSSTEYPSLPQRQASGVSSTEYPPVPQRQASGDSSTEYPPVPQRQASSVSGTEHPQLPQPQASGVSSTEYPPVPQRQASSVSGTEHPQLPQPQAGGVSGTEHPPLPQPQASGVSSTEHPPLPQGQASGDSSTEYPPVPQRQASSVSGTEHPQLPQPQAGGVSGTEHPPLPQPQASGVSSTEHPPLPQPQASGVSSTEYPPLPQRQASGVSGTEYPPLPQRRASGVSGTEYPPLPQRRASGVSRIARPQLPQQQGTGARVGSVWSRPPPQQKDSGGEVGNAWVRPPQLRQQHGGGNQQQQVVDRPHPLPQSKDKALVKLWTLINSKDPKLVPMPRPDRGNNSGEQIELLANHFHVSFNPETTIMRYNVSIQPSTDENQQGKKLTNKSDLREIRKKLCADMPDKFPIDKTAYDGERNIFSAVELPERTFTVKCSVGDDSDEECSYKYTVKLVADLKFSKLKEYLSRNSSSFPRDILQAMNLVMKENPSRCRISVGRCFYSKVADIDNGHGVAVHSGFQQSLKPTSRGLALCLDYSDVELVKSISVIDFLEELFQEPLKDIFKNKHEAASNALAGLKVTVSHRHTKQKFLIKKLTEQNTRALTFLQEDQGSTGSGKKVHLVDYFRTKYEKEIKLKDFPSLEIGKEKDERKNYVPIEFCSLVGRQRYSKDKRRPLHLRKPPLTQPQDRKDKIRAMVRAADGPCGPTARNFEIKVDTEMTCISGRILPAPVLKLGGQSRVSVNDKCQWNFLRESVVEGKKLKRWALIDFSSEEHNSKLRLDIEPFVRGLRDRCGRLGVNMEEPALKHYTGMHELSAVGKVENLLNAVVKGANQKIKGKLQMIVCVMTSKHNGYKYVKWVSETKIGIVTQCCLSPKANKGQDQYLALLCMKINAKLGGSNVELMDRLPNFGSEDNVMFIGADVNHPAAKNDDNPSIAAVVATVNWPAANKYAARVRPQAHRTEKIQNFGDMCKDLVNTYAEFNSVKPNRIVVFRDGVSESQFDMVLNEELLDLAEKIKTDCYQPAITLVVAQKRHHTRLFPESSRLAQKGRHTRRFPESGNVRPGTVVDTQIVHPSDFDFFLCSHYGQLGTSKPTHYHVLWDDNHFSSHSLQRLIYNMCFTFARCATPVSLVPPVYYADLVAYRGRMFQEVLMEMNSPESTTSLYAVTSSSSSSPTASFEQRFYDLHPDLQNIMFFV